MSLTRMCTHLVCTPQLHGIFEIIGGRLLFTELSNSLFTPFATVEVNELRTYEGWIERHMYARPSFCKASTSLHALEMRAFFFPVKTAEMMQSDCQCNHSRKRSLLLILGNMVLQPSFGLITGFSVGSAPSHSRSGRESCILSALISYSQHSSTYNAR